MKPTMIVLIVVVIVLLVITAGFAADFFGIIDIPFFNQNNINPDDPNAPKGSDYCGYTDMQILEMIELASGKDLNNQVGIGFVNSLSMVACGSDDTTSSEVMNDYRQRYFDWYIQLDETNTGPGWTSRTITWTNDNDAANSTFAKMVSSITGTTVKTAYDYNTITIHSDGTIATYQAFILWLMSS